MGDLAVDRQLFGISFFPESQNRACSPLPSWLIDNLREHTYLVNLFPQNFQKYKEYLHRFTQGVCQRFRHPGVRFRPYPRPTEQHLPLRLGAGICRVGAWAILTDRRLRAPGVGCRVLEPILLFLGAVRCKAGSHAPYLAIDPCCVAWLCNSAHHPSGAWGHGLWKSVSHAEKDHRRCALSSA